jgi:hypothetical protein
MDCDHSNSQHLLTTTMWILLNFFFGPPLLVVDEVLGDRCFLSVYEIF